MTTQRRVTTEPTEFEIYQGDAGYVAVTNEVRRQILAALAKKERDLNELVKITGKAKPTLSNLHMKELLAQNLIEELAHPTDQRRKLYRLKGQRIGASNVPIDQLRGAVKHYVSLSPLAHSLPLQQVMGVLLSAGGPKHAEAVQRQAAQLGEISSQLFTAPDLRELLPRVASYWEREGISRTARIDMEHLALEVDVNPKFVESKDAVKLVPALLAGFLEGVMRKLDAKAVRGTLSGSRVKLVVE